MSVRTFSQPTRNLRAYGLWAFFAFILGLTFNQPALAQGVPTLDSEERAFVDLLNNYRRQNGITTPVQVSITLTNAARWHGADMGQKGYFNHIDSLGRDPFARMAAFGYAYQTAKAENIAAGNSTAAATFEQWRNSPGHNQNMLNPAYHAIGIGRVHTPGSTYGYYWTNKFGGFVDQTIGTTNSTRRTLHDYDGDGKADLGIWRATAGLWSLLQSANGTTRNQQWGLQNDIAVPADYDGDGKTDLAVWRPREGVWYIIQSATGAQRTLAWGSGFAPYNDIPVPADYDGDGKADIAVWRPGQGVWFINQSTTGTLRALAFGTGVAPYNDIPVPADYDGDGKTDVAVWRPAIGVWFINQSTTGTTRILSWGTGTAPYNDIPVPADYDGDGKADVAVWRTSNGVWFINQSATGTLRALAFGAGTAPYNDVPAPADYDGDGKADVTVWRPNGGVWFINQSTTGTTRAQPWGAPGDKPI